MPATGKETPEQVPPFYTTAPTHRNNGNQKSDDDDDDDVRDSTCQPTGPAGGGVPVVVVRIRFVEQIENYMVVAAQNDSFRHRVVFQAFTRST